MPSNKLSILEDEREVFIKNTMKGFKLKRSEVLKHMETDKYFIKKYGIFIVEIAYPNLEDARETLTTELEKLKYKNIDSCGERAEFKARPGNWRKFESHVKAIAKKEKIKLRRVMYILDSGLGMVYLFPEDSI